MKKDNGTLRDVKGQGLVEYSIILVLVAAAVVGALTTLGGQVAGFLASVTNAWP
jgi:pilus assembly protein Flp/PilA